MTFILPVPSAHGMSRPSLTHFSLLKIMFFIIHYSFTILASIQLSVLCLAYGKLSINAIWINNFLVCPGIDVSKLTNPVPHLRGGHLSDQLAFQDDTSVSVNQQDPLCLKNIDFPNQEVISASAQDSWALLLEKLEIWTNDSRDLILYFQGEKSLSQK